MAEESPEFELDLNFIANMVRIRTGTNGQLVTLRRNQVTNEYTQTPPGVTERTMSNLWATSKTPPSPPWEPEDKPPPEPGPEPEPVPQPRDKRKPVPSPRDRGKPDEEELRWEDVETGGRRRGHTVAEMPLGTPADDFGDDGRKTPTPEDIHGGPGFDGWPEVANEPEEPETDRPVGVEDPMDGPALGGGDWGPGGLPGGGQGPGGTPMPEGWVPPDEEEENWQPPGPAQPFEPVGPVDNPPLPEAGGSFFPDSPVPGISFSLGAMGISQNAQRQPKIDQNMGSFLSGLEGESGSVIPEGTSIEGGVDSPANPRSAKADILRKMAGREPGISGTVRSRTGGGHGEP